MLQINLIYLPICEISLIFLDPNFQKEREKFYLTMYLPLLNTVFNNKISLRARNRRIYLYNNTL